ncbi:hypothetical protein N9N67_10230, partial [Bacteriovoracaceae bacterium]|nr:hypothetical protein [Bacteriovoracaceae bacterium]
PSIMKTTSKRQARLKILPTKMKQNFLISHREKRLKFRLYQFSNNKKPVFERDINQEEMILSVPKSGKYRYEALDSESGLTLEKGTFFVPKVNSPQVAHFSPLAGEIISNKDSKVQFNIKISNKVKNQSFNFEIGPYRNFENSEKQLVHSENLKSFTYTLPESTDQHYFWRISFGNETLVKSHFYYHQQSHTSFTTHSPLSYENYKEITLSSSSSLASIEENSLDKTENLKSIQNELKKTDLKAPALKEESDLLYYTQ